MNRLNGHPVLLMSHTSLFIQSMALLLMPLLWGCELIGDLSGRAPIWHVDPKRLATDDSSPFPSPVDLYMGGKSQGSQRLEGEEFVVLRSMGSDLLRKTSHMMELGVGLADGSGTWPKMLGYVQIHLGLGEQATKSLTHCLRLRPYDDGCAALMAEIMIDREDFFGLEDWEHYYAGWQYWASADQRWDVVPRWSEQSNANLQVVKVDVAVPLRADTGEESTPLFRYDFLGTFRREAGWLYFLDQAPLVSVVETGWFPVGHLHEGLGPISEYCPAEGSVPRHVLREVYGIYLTYIDGPFRCPGAARRVSSLDFQPWYTGKTKIYPMQNSKDYVYCQFAWHTQRKRENKIPDSAVENGVGDYWGAVKKKQFIDVIGQFVSPEIVQFAYGGGWYEGMPGFMLRAIFGEVIRFPFRFNLDDDGVLNEEVRVSNWTVVLRDGLVDRIVWEEEGNVDEL